MIHILNYTPGEEVTIFLDVKDGYGVRANSETLPIVSRIVFPGMNLAANYPQNTTQIDVGLYYYKFTLPIGSTSVGSYLVEVEYKSPINDLIVNEYYHLIVSAPYGNYSATIGV